MSVSYRISNSDFTNTNIKFNINYTNSVNGIYNVFNTNLTIRIKPIDISNETILYHDQSVPNV